MDLLNTSTEADDIEALFGLKLPDPFETSTNDASVTVTDVVDNSVKSVIYVEARIARDFEGDSEFVLQRLRELFDSQHVCILGLEMELMGLQANSNIFPDGLESVKAVECICNNALDYLTFLQAGTPKFEVNVYKLQTEIETHPALPGTLFLMPSTRHEGVWERLVFENDMRENILRVLVNMFKFSRRRPRRQYRRMNPLVLFTGQPGTGKTSLAVAVIQKLAIRLNMHYDQTRLLQVKAAPLVSKYFGESAQRISEMFNTINMICTSNPRQFLCVLIDEVESLVSSRKAADDRSEIQDTIRATNALLTGIDLVRQVPNLVIICTSNLISNLDSAFMDRVGRHVAMEHPSLAGRYQILWDGLIAMIGIGVVTFTEMLPNFRDAQNQLLSRPELPSSVLFRLAERLTESKPGYLRSARNLAQIVEVALADRMRTETCSLEEALQHLVDFVDQEDRPQKGLDANILPEVTNSQAADAVTTQQRNELAMAFLNMDSERPTKRIRLS